MKKTNRKGLLCLLLIVLQLVTGTEIVSAKNASGAAAFDNLTWEKILEKNVTSKNGVVQAICATDQYIICLENSGDSSDDNDIAYAYYKNSVDENGNPVEQYSLAFTNDQWDWEHCNGMCYNADADEIYVALYTNQDENSRGCIYVMDPHTLDFKRSIKIADYYNILGIGYYAKKGIYMIQANEEGDYAIKILDGNFEKIADFGAGDLGLGSNSQDMCVCGDYIMNFPLTFDQEGVGSYMNVYAIDYGTETSPDDYPIQFRLLKEVQMNLDTAGYKKMEPESICEVEDGVFIAVIHAVDSKNKRKYLWYKMELDGYYYDVDTDCINGTISASDEILQGGSYTVSYKPNEGYQFGSILVDGIAVDPEEYPSSYTFSAISEDHKISVEYVEKEAAADAGGTVDSGGSGSGQDTGISSEGVGSVQAGGWSFLQQWKLPLAVLGAVLLLLLAGWRYRKHLLIQRRKKYLSKRIRREKEKLARQAYQKETEDFSEHADLDTLLREIEKLEKGE
ncbi:MAG: hypothetical protein Q4B03_10530 [Lachnospiraceae bacterium]|nr:hypothetical protein [Lachnospiraceae bacterium]